LGGVEKVVMSILFEKENAGGGLIE